MNDLQLGTRASFVNVMKSLLGNRQIKNYK